MPPIHLLDLSFQETAEAIAAFVVETDEGPVLVETGPHSTWPHLEGALHKLGYRPEDVRQVLLTHIHLDHAGAAWAFAKKGAVIHVHPVGAPHLAHPDKLLHSARRIYQDQMDTLWGQMEPIAESQLHTPADGEEIEIGGVVFRALYTPGHATHHIAWQVGADVFTGDVGGVRIPGGVVMPPCPPPDIHIEHWLESIARIKQAGAERLWLTHFGPVDEPVPHLDALAARLLDWANWMRPWFESGTPPEEVTPRFQQYVQEQLRSEGITDPQVLQRYELANPAWMSVWGLMRYWKKKLARG